MKMRIFVFVWLIFFVQSIEPSFKKCCCQILRAIANTEGSVTNILNQINSTVNNIQQLSQGCGENVMLIRQSDIPLTIREPGVYCLTEDIVNLGGGDAITIAGLATSLLARRVVIDLNGFTINGGENGIRVAAVKFVLGSVNLEVRNGSINFASEHGIWIEAPIETLLIENVTVTRCGQGGSQPNPAGITVSGTNIGPIVRGCNLSGNFVDGVVIEGAGGFLIDNCTAYQNGSNGFNVLGAIFDGGLIVNSFASSNGLNGFLFQGSIGVNVENCVAQVNQGSGFSFDGSSSYSIVLNCESSRNALDGFTVAGINSQVRGCTALGNTSVGSSIGFNETSGTGTNQFYGNYASANDLNYSGITNVFGAPTVTDPINHTANIEK